MSNGIDPEFVEKTVGWVLLIVGASVGSAMVIVGMVQGLLSLVGWTLHFPMNHHRS
jgi:hypothetical protein